MYISHLILLIRKLRLRVARLQQYMNCELPDIQAGFEKAEEPEIKLLTYVAS